MSRSHSLPSHRLRAVVLTAVAFALVACRDDPVGPPEVADQASAPALAVSAAANTWTARAPMPTARSGLVAAAPNSFVYAIGGQDAGGTDLATVEAYNPATNSWTPKASLPAARDRASGTGVINGKIYVPGGVDGVFIQKSLLVYTPGTNSWEPKADLPVFSANGVAGAISGKLYVLSPGNVFAHQSPPPALHRYDPATNSWATKAAMPTARGYLAAGAVNGLLYAVGGYDASGTTLATNERYTP